MSHCQTLSTCRTRSITCLLVPGVLQPCFALRTGRSCDREVVGIPRGHGACSYSTRPYVPIPVG
eukprot:16580-Eustigmatos_ZCMA.PRE.1